VPNQQGDFPPALAVAFPLGLAADYQLAPVAELNSGPGGGLSTGPGGGLATAPGGGLYPGPRTGQKGEYKGPWDRVSQAQPQSSGFGGTAPIAAEWQVRSDCSARAHPEILRAAWLTLA